MNNIFKYSFLILLLAVVSCAKRTPATDLVSRASFGTEDSRIQFRKDGASKMKYSPTAMGYDDLSGATYILQSADSNSLTYKWENEILTVSIINSNNIDVIVNGTTNTFSPRATDLGGKP
ncbi:MAG: hypothetical protein ACRCWI_07650 [Brevinema sp.]